jgi:methionyl-tRNA formyltransferase
MKYIFAGDRDIAVWVLQALMNQGEKPAALLVSESSKASHAVELIRLSGLSSEFILEGKAFESAEGIALLKVIDPDYIIGIHFPYIIRKVILDLPKVGFLNLHPAFLPYNRGWHTPSWAILEGTPIGATLHFMAEELDNGDVIHQKQLEVLPDDTANTLYVRLKQLELEVFLEALPLLLAERFTRKTLNLNEGNSHKRKDLFSEAIQKITLDKSYRAEYLIDKIRALTTNQWSEAAYFEKNGKRYRLRIEIQEDEL